MNFEYLYLGAANVNTIASLDISNLDKLFLRVAVSNRDFDFEPKYLEQLNKLDISKIVLVIFETTQRSNIAIKNAWRGTFIEENSNYSYLNYNFITADESTKIQCIENKINIILYCDTWINETINDILRTKGLYANLTVVPKEMRVCRYILLINGIFQILRTYARRIKNMQYIQLIDDKVYLKPPAIDL